MWRNYNSHTLLVGMYNVAAITENCGSFSKNEKELTFDPARKSKRVPEKHLLLLY